MLTDAPVALGWWRRTQRIRTAALIPLEVALPDTEPSPIYQQIAAEAFHLGQLRLTHLATAGNLNVTDKTVAEAIGRFAHRSRERKTIR